MNAEDEDALLRGHMPLVRRLAARFSRRCRTRAHERDEALSDALLGALRAVRTWRPDGGASLATWLTACVRRAMVDGLRSRLGRRGSRRSLARLRSVPLVERLCPAVEDPERSRRESAEHAARLVAGCPLIGPECVRSAVACLVGGVPQAEHARDEGVSPSAVSRRLAVARAAMRAWLAGGEGAR